MYVDFQWNESKGVRPIHCGQQYSTTVTNVHTSLDIHGVPFDEWHSTDGSFDELNRWFENNESTHQFPNQTIDCMPIIREILSCGRCWNDHLGNTFTTRRADWIVGTHQLT